MGYERKKGHLNDDKGEKNQKDDNCVIFGVWFGLVWCVVCAAKLWNNATDEIKNASTLRGAKREIKKFCKTLEI